MCVMCAGRVKDVQAWRILDDAARRRRQRRVLDALEEDNFQDDPHADLKMNKRAPKFEETNESSSSLYFTLLTIIPNLITLHILVHIWQF